MPSPLDQQLPELTECSGRVVGGVVVKRTTAEQEDECAGLDGGA
jgi:hypothetical protein